MMIQTTNPLSLLAGMENNGAIQQGWLTEGGNTAAFTANLMQQLALLQGNLANNTPVDAGVLANLQQAAQLPDGSAAGQGLQNFAALFGKSLPTAKKIDQEINLDDTMNALSDVLQYLQALEAESADPAAIQAPTEEGAGQTVTVQDKAAAIATQPEQTPDPATLAAEAAAAAAVVASTSAQQAVRQSEVEQPVSDPVDVEMPAVAADAVLVSAGDEQSALKTAMQPVKAGNQHEAVPTVQAGNDKQSLALEGEWAAAMLHQDNASQSAGQEKQSAQDKALNDLAATVGQPKTAETDKNAFRMTNDIAQLNQAVGTEKTVEVPAMTKPLSHPEWNQELGQKLIWMHKQEMPSAELRLNPQHLGPISIKVDVNQDQATVAFTAQHAAVRDAIEAAIPKLREMLGGQNLNLVDVNVSQQQSEQRQPNDFFRMASEQGRGNSQGNDAETAVNQPAIDIVDEIEAGRAIAGNGLLSLFA
jgi:flagellar hook-length control protein FliK